MLMLCFLFLEFNKYYPSPQILNCDQSSSFLIVTTNPFCLEPLIAYITLCMLGLSRCQLDTRVAAYWPDGVVPYEVDDYYVPWQQFMIEAALTNVERAKFVPWSGQENYITFQ